MTQEDKQLLLKDICTRLLYGFNAEIVDMFGYTGKIYISVDTLSALPALDKSILLRCKPYLRPMSSMTEEEKKELSTIYVFNIFGNRITAHYHSDGYWDDDTELDSEGWKDLFDWLNEHHFDYRGLIEKGLAIEALEGMYK